MTVYGTGLGHFIDTLRYLLPLTLCPSKLAFSESQSRLVVSYVYLVVPTVIHEQTSAKPSKQRCQWGKRDSNVM
jgi:hypothetical protein